jgi:serine/threonine protein kinase
MTEDSASRPAADNFEELMRAAGYEVGERIGSGGMAEVFRALDIGLNRIIALKRMKALLAADEGYRERFTRESRAAAAVEHPHILPVYDAGELSGVLYLVMRLVNGGDVSTLVKVEGPLTSERSCEIVRQVASALDAAHRKGIVHRDVTPSNILLEAPDEAAGSVHAYLADFGLSKKLAEASTFTPVGMFIGTPAYCSPEQLDGRPVDAYSDQYALGCCAFVMLTGEPPFQRSAVFARRMASRPMLTAYRLDVSPRADAVFAKVLADAPADRYPTCTDFARALADVLASPPASKGDLSDGRITEPGHIIGRNPPGSNDGPGSTDEHGPDRRFGSARRLAVMLGAGCAVIVAAALSIIFLTGHHSPLDLKHKAAGTQHSPSKSTTPAPSRSSVFYSGAVTLSAPGNSTVGRCAVFSGTSDLPPGRTLVLGQLNLDDVTRTIYLQPVDNWQDANRLRKWTGAQYFGQGNASVGQTYKILVISIDAKVVRTAPGAQPGVVWHVTKLPPTSEVKQVIRVHRVRGSGACPS